jgi:hypothetical protein
VKPVKIAHNAATPAANELNTIDKVGHIVPQNDKPQTNAPETQTIKIFVQFFMIFLLGYYDP